MVDKRILEYFRMHKGNYRLSDLKNKVLQAGYTKEDIDAALAQLDKESRGNPPTVNATINKINKMNFDQSNTLPAKHATTTKVVAADKTRNQIAQPSVGKKEKNGL